MTANLHPNETGVSAHMHIYKNTKHKARHAARVKVFPGKPHEGNATILTVPHDGDDSSVPIGKVTLPAHIVRKARRFVDRNWEWLLLYWYDPSFNERELLRRLR